MVRHQIAVFFLIASACVASTASEKAVRYAHQKGGGGGPYCGIYSLHACLVALGEPPSDPARLVDRRYVSSFEGSTAADLVAAARDCGFEAKPLKGLTHLALSRASYPMILHMRGDEGANFNHWIAFLGYKGENVVVLDPLYGSQVMPIGGLVANWDGMAIAVSGEPIGESLVILGRAEMLLLAGSICVIVISVHSLIAKWLGPNPSFLNGSIQALAMFAVCVAIATMWHSFDEVGLLRNPGAVADTASRYFVVELPEVSIEDVQVAIGDKDVVIVDARRRDVFDRDHIPGAISMPITSSVQQRLARLDQIPKSKSLIIYCENDRCGWADKIGTFASLNGFDNVSVFRGGAREWLRMANE